MSKATEKKATEKKSLKEYRTLLEQQDETTVSMFEKALNTKKFHIELKDTTSCIMFVLDENNNTVFNVYDNFRIQFTTSQVKKYKDALLTNERFYSFMYKQKEFISAKAKDFDDFIDLCKYCYKVVTDAQTVAQTVTKQTVAKQTVTKQEVAKAQ